MSESLAIIDLGTNTFHLLIAEIDDKEDFRILEKFKEPVELGEHGLDSGEIGAVAFERGIEAIRRLQQMISMRQITEVRAFATSAIRSASNGKDFITKVKAETGMEVKIINGNEEAALIFEGVRNGIQMPHDQNVLVLDIGGGSVEFIVARDGKAQLLRSLDIGAARLLGRFHPSDPMKPSEVKVVREYLMQTMAGLLAELKEFDIRLLVGSSGTYETISAMIAHRKKDFLSSENLNSYRYTARDFKELHKMLISFNEGERKMIPGMDPLRAEMINMGSLLIDVLMEEIGVKEMMVSTYALKEGILFRYIEDQKERIHRAMGNTARNLRAKAIRNICEKYAYKKTHVLKVSELAQSIFDQLRPLHPFGTIERELLRYAAMLHDIGQFVNRSGHHKHGQYLVMNSSLSGFSHDEVIILGNIVRYHRKSLPTRDHFHFKVLEQRQRLMVRVLSGILRIADQLDRGHRGLVDSVKVVIEAKQVKVIVSATDDIRHELENAREQVELLAGAIDREIVVERE
jgi:exopolyphosphatase / guanosine-5'-triphosphate,3'-diphosphate pyrophosphatase